MDRRLTTIVAADVVGYSKLMEADESGTLAALKERRKAILRPLAAQHGGRLFKIMGDGVLLDFPSPVKAVEFAIDLHRAMDAAAAALDALVRRRIDAEPALTLEYLAIAEPRALTPVDTVDAGTVLALAARLGRTRLIDNIILGEGLG